MEQITLGSVTVQVDAQRHAYLENVLPMKLVNAFQREDGLDQGTILSLGADGIYDVLCALIPALAPAFPKWQFRGYASMEAFAAGEYDPDVDLTSPTIPDILNAFEVAIRVNGIADVSRYLGKIPGLRELVAKQVEFVLSDESSSSPSALGASALTSSGTTAPTSTVKKGSRSRASARS